MVGAAVFSSLLSTRFPAILDRVDNEVQAAAVQAGAAAAASFQPSADGSTTGKYEAVCKAMQAAASHAHNQLLSRIPDDCDVIDFSFFRVDWGAILPTAGSGPVLSPPPSPFYDSDDDTDEDQDEAAASAAAAPAAAAAAAAVAAAKAAAAAAKGDAAVAAASRRAGYTLMAFEVAEVQAQSRMDEVELEIAMEEAAELPDGDNNVQLHAGRITDVRFFRPCQAGFHRGFFFNVDCG